METQIYEYWSKPDNIYRQTITFPDWTVEIYESTYEAYKNLTK